MTILYLLIPLSLTLLGLAVWAFFWAVKNDQFDDLEGPAHRILFDDDLPPPAKHRPSDDSPASREPPS
ncbi:cbb3-type cytochrome oxidase assembly protein CcoS [Vreelandella sp. EE22]